MSLDLLIILCGIGCLIIGIVVGYVMFSNKFKNMDE